MHDFRQVKACGTLRFVPWFAHYHSGDDAFKRTLCHTAKPAMGSGSSLRSVVIIKKCSKSEEML